MGYFKSFFGSSRDEIWSALRAQIGGELIPGTFWRGERLQARVGEWTVTLDEYTVMVMAGRVPTHMFLCSTSPIGSEKSNGLKDCTTFLLKRFTNFRKWVSPPAEPAA